MCVFANPSRTNRAAEWLGPAGQASGGQWAPSAAPAQTGATLTMSSVFSCPVWPHFQCLQVWKTPTVKRFFLLLLFSPISKGNFPSAACNQCFLFLTLCPLPPLQPLWECLTAVPNISAGTWPAPASTQTPLGSGVWGFWCPVGHHVPDTAPRELKKGKSNN